MNIDITLAAYTLLHNIFRAEGEIEFLLAKLASKFMHTHTHCNTVYFKLLFYSH